jgi:predicted regulator of Ras-like GTPase activity (Roadblock/LC7/MglB family)
MCSTACCRLSAGVTPSLQQQLSRSLIKIGEIFPGTDTILVLRQDGTVAFQQIAGDVEQAEVISVVSSLKRAALQLAETLGQSECPALHVKGGKNIFSCYDAGPEFSLAFFTSISEPDLECFDTSEADRKMVAIIDEVRSLLWGTI